jgi:hypothetical protein
MVFKEPEMRCHFQEHRHYTLSWREYNPHYVISKFYSCIYYSVELSMLIWWGGT